MTARFFVDTNVLVYAYDAARPDKQARAVQVLRHLARTASGAVSTQVLAEFFVTVVYKSPVRMSSEEAYERLEYYLNNWTVIGLSGEIILRAARAVRDYKFSFWDAQIWAAARLNGLSEVLSEDFNSGATIEGVRFINPFADDFQITEALG